MEEIDKKREEIWEDVARTFYEDSDVSKTITWRDLPVETRDSFFYKADNLLYRLSTIHGVVIKRDYKISLSTPMPAGSEFVAVESLVKTDV